MSKMNFKTISRPYLGHHFVEHHKRTLNDRLPHTFTLVDIYHSFVVILCDDGGSEDYS